MTGWMWNPKTRRDEPIKPDPQPKLPEGYSYGSIGRLHIGTLIQCDSCGAAVTDMDIHDAWHGRTDK